MKNCFALLPLTFLFPSALMGHHSSQCQCHSSGTGNHILLLGQTQVSHPQWTKFSSEPDSKSREWAKSSKHPWLSSLALVWQRKQGQQLSRVAAMLGWRKNRKRQLTLKKLYEDAVSFSSKLDVQTLWALHFQNPAPVLNRFSNYYDFFVFQEGIWYCRKKPQEMLFDFGFFLFNSTEITRDTNYWDQGL